MATIDENFLCGCGGVLAPLKEQQSDGLLEYGCTSCARTGPIECPLCHNPRTLWMDYGKKCFFCGNGKQFLSSAFKAIFEKVAEGV